MYEVDGIDLTRSQFLELCDLVDLPTDDARAEFSNKALHPYDDKRLWNPNGVWVYTQLAGYGLIDGEPAMGAFLFHGVVTQRGLDWVEDYRAQERERKGELWSDRRFQIGLSLFTLVLSAVLGWVSGHFL